MIHIYTGNGKGKSTASFGLAVRTLGYGRKVCLIQFMKKDAGYGEIRFLSSIANIDIFQFGTDTLIQPGKLSPQDLAEAQAAIRKVFTVLQQDLYDLIIIDEINVAVAWGLIPLEEQKKVFDITTRAEIVMTGRSAHPEIIALADLVTEMREIKHYYQENVPARTGIEF